jgi:hypothetical protein
VKLAVALAISLLLVPAVGASAERDLPTIDAPSWPDPDLLRFFGKRNLDTIKDATRVDVYEIENDPHRWRRPAAGDGPRRLYGFPVRKVRQKAPPALATAIKEAVLTPRYYRIGTIIRPDSETSETSGYGTGKGCLFDPGAIFRFTRGQRTTDVLLCFGCDDLAIGPRPADALLRRFDDIEELDRVDITAGSDVFKKLVQRAFVTE